MLCLSVFVILISFLRPTGAHWQQGLVEADEAESDGGAGDINRFSDDDDAEIEFHSVLLSQPISLLVWLLLFEGRLNFKVDDPLLSVGVSITQYPRLE